MQVVEVQDLRVPSKRVAMVSRKVFWGASSPFITGIFPARCEILHQSLSRRMVQKESAKKGEGKRDDSRGGEPGAVVGPIRRRRRVAGDRERVPAATARAGASQRALWAPAPHLGAQPGTGSLCRPLHRRQPPSPLTVPPRVAVPAGRRCAVPRPPPSPPSGKEPAVAGAPRPDLRRRGGGGGAGFWASLGGA